MLFGPVENDTGLGNPAELSRLDMLRARFVARLLGEDKIDAGW